MSLVFNITHLSVCVYSSEGRGGEGGDEETVLNSFGFLDDEDSDEDDNEDDDEEGEKDFYQQDQASVSQAIATQDPVS